jgi:hypothetical protein
MRKPILRRSNCKKDKDLDEANYGIEFSKIRTD